MKRVRGHIKNRKGQVDGYQSDLERAVAMANGCMEHSTIRVPYVPKPRAYVPDFSYILGDNEKLLLIEVKGLFSSSDRVKSVAIKKNYVDIARLFKVDCVELVFVFSHGDYRLEPKNSKSKTYLEWCAQQGFRAIDVPYFPDEWFDLGDT